MKNNFMQIYNLDDDKSDIYLYGEIEGEGWFSEGSDNTIRRQIENLKASEINLHINSLGGSVFAGVAIYNLLKQKEAHINVYIDSIAASIASVIAMAGDKIYMPENAMMMIHNCWTIAAGNSEELRKQADDLELINESTIIKSYLSRVNISEEELKEYLDKESFLSAKQCVEMGFADEIIPLKEKGANALFNLVNKIRQLEKPIDKQEEPKQEVIEQEDKIEEPTLLNSLSKLIKGKVSEL